MSNENAAKLEGINRELRFNSIFFAVGMFVFLFSALAGNVLYVESYFKVMMIGWVIMGGPRIWRAIFGGFGAALSPKYEVLTKDGYGNVVSSDGGAQSIQMDLLSRIIAAAAFAAIGGFITIIHVLILTIKYLATAAAAKAKSSVVPNGFIIILINTAAVIGSIVIGALINMTVNTVQTVAYRAETGISRSGDYDIRKNDTKDGIIIGKYEGSKGGAIVIPATFDGLPVVCLERTFVESGNPPYGTRDNRKERITSVVIPDTVTVIDGAFYGCEELTQITLPKNLKLIMSDAFKFSGITSIVIPEGVTDIGNDAFAGCAKLTSVTLPQSLKRVGSSAFGKCTSLTEVKIPSGSTIRHGEYVTNLYGKKGTFIMNMKLHLLDEQSKSLQHETFGGCTKLSAASRQALKDAGYTGEF